VSGGLALASDSLEQALRSLFLIARGTTAPLNRAPKRCGRGGLRGWRRRRLGSGHGGPGRRLFQSHGRRARLRQPNNGHGVERPFRRDATTAALLAHRLLRATWRRKPSLPKRGAGGIVVDGIAPCVVYPNASVARANATLPEGPRDGQLSTGAASQKPRLNSGLFSILGLRAVSIVHKGAGLSIRSGRAAAAASLARPSSARCRCPYG